MPSNTAIRPRIPRWFHVVCTLFAVAGLGLMIDALYVGDALHQLIAGLFAVLVFGGAWAIAHTVLWLRPVTLMMEREGIWYYTFGARGLIPWQDIKKVGAVDIVAIRALGLRLHHPEHFLASLLSTRADALGQIPLYPAAKVERLSRRMEAARRDYGYDILIPAIFLDRSISAMILMFEDHRWDYAEG